MKEKVKKEKIVKVNGIYLPLVPKGKLYDFKLFKKVMESGRK